MKFLIFRLGGKGKEYLTRTGREMAWGAREHALGVSSLSDASAIIGAAYEVGMMVEVVPDEPDQPA